MERPNTRNSRQQPVRASCSQLRHVRPHRTHNFRPLLLTTDGRHTIVFNGMLDGCEVLGSTARSHMPVDSAMPARVRPLGLRARFTGMELRICMSLWLLKERFIRRGKFILTAAGKYQPFRCYKTNTNGRGTPCRDPRVSNLLLPARLSRPGARGEQFPRCSDRLHPSDVVEIRRMRSLPEKPRRRVPLLECSCLP
jgi:hypothetical protein